MKLRCAILDDFQNIALSMADWASLQNQVDVFSLSEHFTDEDALVEAIGDCDIVVIMRERTPFKAPLLARLPKLKLLITSGMRNASIDLNTAAAQGVTVCGTASGSEPPMELTWALILGLARHIVPENNAFRQRGVWQSTLGVTLSGKRLGILGLGKIGRRMAQVAQAFGMNVCAWSQNLTQQQADEAGVTLASSKEELLASSDFVSIHLVLSDRTRGLIGQAELNLMKPTAFLINTSRAAIVDQDALIEALNHQRIAGAGLDVFAIEPLPEDHILRTLPNVLATPHLGYVADSNYQGYFKGAVEDIQAFIDGKPVRKLS
jgi:phosphoglycerate dehydrogenase-like enzyme